jgi:hypothetical protein
MSPQPFSDEPQLALIRALEAATRAGQWAVATRLAELIAKVESEPARVVELDAERLRRGR